MEHACNSHKISWLSNKQGNKMICVNSSAKDLWSFSSWSPQKQYVIHNICNFRFLSFLYVLSFDLHYFNTPVSNAEIAFNTKKFSSSKMFQTLVK